MAEVASACDTVFDLPELMAVIFSHLSPKELVWRVPLVCRRWRDMAAAYRHPMIPVDLQHGCVEALKIISRRLPKTAGLSVSYIPSSAWVFDLAAFSKLDFLQATTTSFESRHYKRLMGLKLSTLEVRDVRLPGPAIMAKSDNTCLQELSLSMCSTYALHSTTGAEVVKLVKSAPNLRALRLRRVGLRCEDVRAMLLACPRLEVLQLWTNHASTDAATLECIGTYGTALTDVVFTKHELSRVADGLFRYNCDLDAHVTAAFGLFEALPGLRRLRIRRTGRDLAALASERRAGWILPDGCSKPSVDFANSVLIMKR